MDADRPKALREESARIARAQLLNEAHVRPLTHFVRGLRQARGDNGGVPYFDPHDGGVNAQCLFLLEAPGARAVGSGFVSRNNPDETAKNFFLLNAQAGLDRRCTITWNIVPWYVGTATAIRAATKADIRSALPHLHTLLKMLPNLRVIVLLGRKAQCAADEVSALQPQAQILNCPHPSPKALNGRPERRAEILRTLRYAARLCDA